MTWQYRGGCIKVFILQLVLLGLGVAGLALSGLAIDVIRHSVDPGAPSPRWPLGVDPPASWTPFAAVMAMGSAVLVMAAARALLNFSYSIAVGKLVHLRLVPEIRTLVFDRLQRLSFRFFDEHASGSIINRVTGDVQSLRSFVDGVVIQGAIMILSLGVYLVVMLRTHVGLSLACLLVTPFVATATTLFSRWARPAYRRSRALADDMVLAMSEGVHGIQVTKVFGREDHEFERFRAKNQAVLDQQQNIFRKVSRFGPTIQFVMQVDVGVLLIYGGVLVARGTLTLGDLIVFAGLLQQFSGQVSKMTGVINTLQQSLTGARRVFEVLDAPIEISTPPRAVRPPRIQGHVRFESVEFSYKDDVSVLRGIDIDAHPGQCVALLGVTGSGKSTLLSLIPRFFDVTRGRVTVDGIDVRDLDLDVLRRSIGLVFQESLLFRTTVAQNIAFGFPDASREAIERAAKLAAAHDFVQQLPEGYDTLLEEGAANLSGGQRQRLAIARALLLDPPILLLDDPTTAIDPGTEHEVLKAVQGATHGRTTFIAANRLSTLRRADTILVVHGGRIVERGSHAELMASGGIYCRAASLQTADHESLRLLGALEATS